MERETIETLLEKLSLEEFTNNFTDQQLDLEFLIEISEDELKETLLELNLPVGPRRKIFKALTSLKKMGK